jgi:hypothetical protein
VKRYEEDGREHLSRLRFIRVYYADWKDPSVGMAPTLQRINWAAILIRQLGVYKTPASSGPFSERKPL